MYYNKFKKNVFSQNGEDGILEKIFEELNIQPKFMCEFGAADGIMFSNTRNLMLKFDAKCIMIEPEDENFTKLKLMSELNKGIIPVHAAVSADKNSETSLDSILSKNNFPVDFDFLSIDVDSIDHYIWQSCEIFKPKVVIIEISSLIHPESNEILGEYTNGHYKGAGAHMHGFSRSVEIFKNKDYSAVCHSGNIIYVRNDLMSRLSIPKALINHIGLFDWSWYKPKNLFK